MSWEDSVTSPTVIEDGHFVEGLATAREGRSSGCCIGSLQQHQDPEKSGGSQGSSPCL